MAVERGRGPDRRRGGPSYFAALVAGAAPGAWLAGPLNTLRGSTAVLSHSVVGGLVGAVVGVEIYKAVRGVRGSTGGVFVGSFALGCAVGAALVVAGRAVMRSSRPPTGGGP